MELTGDGPSADVSTHCRRELMHAIWAILLNDDFLYAYEHGIVILCPDGTSRRFYPKFFFLNLLKLNVIYIFMYSADYPEK